MKYFKYNSKLYPLYAILYEVKKDYIKRYHFCRETLDDIRILNRNTEFLSSDMYIEISKLEFESHFEL